MKSPEESSHRSENAEAGKSEEKKNQQAEMTFTMRELINRLDKVGEDDEVKEANGLDENRTREEEIQEVRRVNNGFMEENEQENGGLFSGVTVYEGERQDNSASSYPGYLEPGIDASGVLYRKISVFFLWFVARPVVSDVGHLLRRAAPASSLGFC